MAYKDPDQRREYHKANYIDTGYMKKYQAEWYRKNKEKVQARQAARLLKIKQRVHNYKLFHGCDECGYNRSAYALQFHHLDGKGNEQEGISALMMRGWKWEKILEHIKECRLLCANCHMELHDDGFGTKF